MDLLSRSKIMTFETVTFNSSESPRILHQAGRFHGLKGKVLPLSFHIFIRLTLAIYLLGKSALWHRKTIQLDTRRWTASGRFPGKPQRILLDSAVVILQLKDGRIYDIVGARHGQVDSSRIPRAKCHKSNLRNVYLL